MTTPDRTEELVRAMLERRAGGTVPDWLIGSTMQQVATSRQSRRRRSGMVDGSDGARLVLIAAVALALLTLASVLAAGAFLRRDATPFDPRVAVVDPGPTPRPTGEPVGTAPVEASDRASSPSTATPTPRTTPTTEPTSEEYPNGIDIEREGPAVDALARVTQAGDGLRVRTAPGLGDDSERLEPLLPAGAEVFVVDGPVRADGYDWFQVLADAVDYRLFGWVASGTDEDTWLATDSSECTSRATADDVIERPAPEYLACFGDEPVTVTARINDGLGPLSEGTTEEDIACPDLIRAEGCDLPEGWLQIPLGGVYFPLGDDMEASLSVAVPPDGETRFYDAPLQRDVELTIAMDSPEARDCRILDSRTGADHVPRDEAITRCRLTFVLRDIDW